MDWLYKYLCRFQSRHRWDHCHGSQSRNQRCWARYLRSWKSTACVAQQISQRTRAHYAQVVWPHHWKYTRSCKAHDAWARQASHWSCWWSGLWRLICRVVCWRSETCRGLHSGYDLEWQAPHGLKATDWCMRSYYAMELPDCDDHAQDCTCISGRMHHRD